jgi:glycolate oxidase FAD binding subunit
VIEGRTPEAAVFPGSVEEVAAVVARAAEAGVPVVPWGGGTAVGVGVPPERGGIVLHLGRLVALVEHEPGDLTATAQAGITLAALQASLRARGQWLSLDPPDAARATLGGVLAANASGPRRHLYGTARDVLIGVTVVTGAGAVVRGGGRVVKNVAGFDLTRLLVGSWGTLGVITEVTLRLRARPELTRTLAIDITPQTLGSLAARLRALPFSPLASELLNPSLARKTGLGQHACLLVQLGGNERSLHAQQDVVRDLGSSRDAPDDVWNALRRIATAAAVWRWSQLPSQFGETWTAAEAVARQLPGTMVHGNPARGVVRVVVPDSLPAEPTVIRDSTRFTGTVAIESLPAAAWADIDQQAAGDPISRAIRAKFDPAGILNTGILGDAA